MSDFMIHVPCGKFTNKHRWATHECQNELCKKFINLLNCEREIEGKNKVKNLIQIWGNVIGDDVVYKSKSLEFPMYTPCGNKFATPNQFLNHKCENCTCIRFSNNVKSKRINKIKFRYIIEWRQAQKEQEKEDIKLLEKQLLQEDEVKISMDLDPIQNTKMKNITLDTPKSLEATQRKFSKGEWIYQPNGVEFTLSKDYRYHSFGENQYSIEKRNSSIQSYIEVDSDFTLGEKKI